jgi:hypothetical protein
VRRGNAVHPFASLSAKRADVAIAPRENECVIRRGDNARIIADNLVVPGK